ncbi:hypothetical protein [Aeromicrobium sp.]|uniref:hypothetical protein n=1 Tax=Aeromicrobium sp. TaxID=1871063 RepID=UPI0030C02B75
MSEKLLMLDDWIPAACTLPTVELPLRRTEFDDLFSADVIDVARATSGSLRLELDPTPAVAARAAGLAAKETSCCSFFTFALTMTGGTIVLTVSTELHHEPILDALASRAESMARGLQ